MRKIKIVASFFVLLAVCPFSYAEDASVPVVQQTVIAPKEDKIGNITLDFKDADIRTVLKVISLKTGMNIVPSPEVTGMVTVYLEDVPWESALKVILTTYGFGYDKRDNIVAVAPMEKLTEQKKMEQELSQVQPTVTEVFKLQYIDALDAKKALENLTSPRGKITVLETTGKAGWEFGGEALGKKARGEKERKSLTKILLVADIPPVIDKMKVLLSQIDIKPKQIMIEAKILEVSRDYLDDIGFEYATGTVSSMDEVFSFDKGKEIGGSSKNGVINSITPAVFNPLATGLTPETAGMKLVVQKILGKQFQAIFHALEEDVYANLLSAPRILTLDNQEATILVGEKYPILKTTSSEGTTTTQKSLDYYQDIGIQLNVVPQVSGENKINMIVHPAVTSFTQVVGDPAQVAYPRIVTREAETQLLMNDGETIVIGGLIKDYDNKSEIGTPFLSKIPVLGWLFKRHTRDTAKIELLIFITARIVNEDGLSDKDMAFLEQTIANSKNKK